MPGLFATETDKKRSNEALHFVMHEPCQHNGLTWSLCTLIDPQKE